MTWRGQVVQDIEDNRQEILIVHGRSGYLQHGGQERGHVFHFGFIGPETHELTGGLDGRLEYRRVFIGVLQGRRKQIQQCLNVFLPVHAYRIRHFLQQEKTEFPCGRRLLSRGGRQELQDGLRRGCIHVLQGGCHANQSRPYGSHLFDRQGLQDLILPLQFGGCIKTGRIMTR